jgi:hypothetical protein
MSDYRKYSNVTKVERGYFPYRMFLKLDCGHEVYRYQKTPPAKVLCEHCHRQAWFPPNKACSGLAGTAAAEGEGSQPANR